MVTLYCDLGDTRDVACGLVEPLHFEDGYAEVDDEDQAAQIVARHQHIHYPATHPDASGRPSMSEGESDGDELPVDPSDLTVAELNEWAVEIEDPAVLDAVIAAEYSGKDRSSAIDRLEQRQSSLTEVEE